MISNASDALDKRKYLGLTDKKIAILRNPRSNIGVDNKKTLTISDNGIGMNEEDLKSSLGTIEVRNKSFFRTNFKNSKDKKTDMSMIGQFGEVFMHHLWYRMALK